MYISIGLRALGYGIGEILTISNFWEPSMGICFKDAPGVRAGRRLRVDTLRAHGA